MGHLDIIREDGWDENGIQHARVIAETLGLTLGVPDDRKRLMFFGPDAKLVALSDLLGRDMVEKEVS